MVLSLARPAEFVKQVIAKTETMMVRLPLTCAALLMCAACDRSKNDPVAAPDQRMTSVGEEDAVTLAEQTMDNAMNAMSEPAAKPDTQPIQ